MKYSILYLFVVLSSLELVRCMVGRTWEFLRDRPNSRVVLVSKGSMTPLSKVATTAIQLPLSCYKVVYVRVVVDNPADSPRVFYDANKRSVRIAYDIEQNSQSQYKIYVKAVNNCHKIPRPLNKVRRPRKRVIPDPSLPKIPPELMKDRYQVYPN